MTWPGPSSDDDLPPLDVHVPDDARELDADLLAYRREQREAARTTRAYRHSARLRRHTLGRVLAGRRGLSMAAVVLAALVTAVAATGLALLGPRQAARPPAATLASSPTAAPGDVGGLLPDAQVRGQGVQAARGLRPAVLAVVSPGCGCAATLQAVHRQAAEFTLRLYLVAPPGTGPAVRRLATEAQLGQVTTVVDESGALTAAYGDDHPTGEAGSGSTNGAADGTADGAAAGTYVLVHADGVVREILTDVTPRDRLELHLAPLAEPGART